jgi:hypothetical protein
LGATLPRQKRNPDKKIEVQKLHQYRKNYCVISSVIYGNHVMTRRGEVRSQDLRVDDHILTYHSGFEAIVRLRPGVVKNVSTTLVRKGRFQNDRDFVVHSSQRIRCDTEAVSLNSERQAILSKAALLADENLVRTRTSKVVSFVEIELRVPCLIWISGGIMELRHSVRHKGVLYPAKQQPVEFEDPWLSQKSVLASRSVRRI